MTISQAQKPEDRDIEELRQWLIRPSMGDNFLVGIEVDVWKDEYAEDFISPTSAEIDLFDSFLTGPVLDAYHWLYGHKKKVGTYQYVINNDSSCTDANSRLMDRILNPKTLEKI